MAAAIFGGAGELHSFCRTTVTIPVVIVVIAIVISVMIAVPITVAVVVGIVTMDMIAIVVSRTIHLTSVHDEIRTAAVIDPYALLIESPACSLNAG